MQTTESEDDVDGKTRTTQPALDVWEVDKFQLLFDGNAERTPPIQAWVDGFDDTRAIINWWQAAAVRSFGTIVREFDPRDIRRDDALRRRLLADTDEAEAYRRRLMRAGIEPALADSWNRLSDLAAERVTPDDSDDDRPDYQIIDPEKQKHVAMMPAHTRLDSAQSRVLASLWEGFESVDALDRWVAGLSVATRGELDREFARQFMNDEANRRRMLGPGASAYRERFAIFVLLPRFARAAYRLKGAELSDEIEDRTRIEYA